MLTDSASISEKNPSALPDAIAETAFSCKNPSPSETLLGDSRALAASLEACINSATESIELETYIYRNDNFGRKVENLLVSAKQRGVAVRVSVDGIGSRGWIYSVGKRLKAQGIEVKVYNQLIWEKFASNDRLAVSDSWLKFFQLVNRRDHRKVCIVDSKVALVSSMNIWDESIPAIRGNKAWREIGILVEGEAVHILKAAFNLIWFPRLPGNRKVRKQARRIVNNSAAGDTERSTVRLNSSYRLRSYFYTNLIEQLENAKDRIYLASPYFVPTKKILTALSDAVKRGVDVKVITSRESDIFFMPWVSSQYLYELAKNSVELFAYSSSIFHAKYMLIDGHMMVGSSNMNSRSLHHDLEADIKSSNLQLVQALQTEFEKDLSRSIKLESKDFTRQSLWKRLIAKVILLFRNYI